MQDDWERLLEQWDYIKTIVRRNITSANQYQDLVDAHEKLASRFIARRIKRSGPAPTRKKIKRLHEIAFDSVYGFAGSFRKKGERVSYGHGRKEGAYPSTIKRELAELEKLAKDLFQNADSPDKTARAIGFYHAKLKSIHPFLDGNSRVCWLISQQQASELLELRPRRLLDREKYDLHLFEAQETGDLFALTYTLCGIRLSEELRKSPAPIPVWPTNIEKEILQTRKVPISCENHNQAEQVDFAKVSNDLKEYAKAHSISQIKLIEPATKTGRALIDLTERQRQNLERERSRNIDRGPSIEY